MEKENKWQAHLSTTNPKLITELGVALGYPSCCVREFCDVTKRQSQGKSPKRSDKLRLRAAYVDDVFTGFVPCKSHAQQILKGKISLGDLINDRSSEFSAFPFWELLNKNT